MSGDFQNFQDDAALGHFFFALKFRRRNFDTENRSFFLFPCQEF